MSEPRCWTPIQVALSGDGRSLVQSVQSQGEAALGSAACLSTSSLCRELAESQLVAPHPHTEAHPPPRLYLLKQMTRLSGEQKLGFLLEKVNFNQYFLQEYGGPGGISPIVPLLSPAALKGFPF